MANTIHEPERAASDVIEWSTLATTNHTTTLGAPQDLILAIWFTARTLGGATVELFKTSAGQSAQYYQRANIDPRWNCHGETFGPLHPTGERYNIHEGNVQDVLDEGFAVVSSSAIVQAGDVAVWMEPNRTAVHSARVESSAGAAGNVDWAHTVLWTKNGLACAGPMSLADVESLYRVSWTSAGIVQPTTVEFWRPRRPPGVGP